MGKKVYEVTAVTVEIVRKPFTIQIFAQGTTITSGWTNPRLDPFIYINPPENGIYEFNFIADEPTGIVPQVITKIEASLLWEHYPTDLKGVKIHAETNSMVGMLKV